MATIIEENTNVKNQFLNEAAFKHYIKQISFKWLEKLSIFDLEKEEVDYYILHYLKPYILTRPLYWYTNPLVKLIKDHVGNELPTYFLSSIEEVENDIEFKRKLTEEKNRYKLKVINKENITEEEIEELIELEDFLSEEIVINYIINKLTNGIKINKELYKRIFLKFVMLFIKMSNLNIIVFDKNIPDINGKTCYAQVKEKYEQIYMYFNTKILNSNVPITTNIFSFFHEFWHLLQYDKEYTPLYYIYMFKMDEILCEIKPEYRENNYYVLSFELDAHINGMKLLYHYFKSIKNKNINYERLSKEIEALTQRKESFLRTDQFGDTIYLDLYFDHIMKSRAINPYKLGFIHTYNETGKRLTPIELYRKREENIILYDKIIENSNYSLQDLEQTIKELEELLNHCPNDKEYLFKMHKIYKLKYIEALNRQKKEDFTKVNHLNLIPNSLYQN